MKNLNDIKEMNSEVIAAHKSEEVQKLVAKDQAEYYIKGLEEAKRIIDVYTDMK